MGTSVRALAQTAVRAGFAPCAIDGFADRDTRMACAGRALRLPLRGLVPDWTQLDAAIREMRHRHAPEGFAGAVAGSGLEGCPELLDMLAVHAPPANAAKEAVQAVATPARWFALLDAIGAPYPEVGAGGTAPGPGWLVKRAGGSGGIQVRIWRAGRATGPGDYLQRRAAGRPASALFLAAAGRARILGWQRQLLAPTAERPFRYGGVMQDDSLPAAVRAAIAEIIAKLARHLPLRGLCGLDFLVDGDEIRVLELNPRPTASLALHPALDIFALHLDACAGRLPDGLPVDAGPRRGEAVVYAQRPLRLPADFPWPAGAADIPAGAAEIPAGAPVCSLHAAAASTRGLARALDDRRQRIFTLLEGRHESEPESQCAGGTADRLAVC